MDNRRHNRGFFDPKLCCRWLIIALAPDIMVKLNLISG